MLSVFAVKKLNYTDTAGWVNWADLLENIHIYYRRLFTGLKQIHHLHSEKQANISVLFKFYTAMKCFICLLIGLKCVYYVFREIQEASQHVLLKTKVTI